MHNSIMEFIFLCLVGVELIFFRTSVRNFLGMRHKEETSYQEQGNDNTVISRSRGISQSNDNNINLHQYASSRNDSDCGRIQKKRQNGKLSLKNYRIKSKNFSQNEAFTDSDDSAKTQCEYNNKLQEKNMIINYLNCNDERDSASELVFLEQNVEQNMFSITNEKNSSKETSDDKKGNKINIFDTKEKRRSVTSYEIIYTPSAQRDSYEATACDKTSNTALETQSHKVKCKSNAMFCGRSQNAPASPNAKVRHSASMEIRRTKAAMNRRKSSVNGAMLRSQESQMKTAMVIDCGNVVTKLVRKSKVEATDVEGLDSKPLNPSMTSVNSEEMV